ncbi:MAG: putative motility protein [Hyphomicrobiales bacterium]|nr:putative motility protein [Hyphomicrobiales bacterium]
MSSSVSIAAAAVAANQAQVQSALAAKIAKMNADAAQSVVALLEASTANLEQISKASLPDGVGTSVDISA